jgi:cystathionine beta-lyase/cystathionine gamma-synthase
MTVLEKFTSGHGDVLAGSVSCYRKDFDKLVENVEDLKEDLDQALKACQK